MKKKNPYSYELFSCSVPSWLLTHPSFTDLSEAPHNVLLYEPVKIPTQQHSRWIPGWTYYTIPELKALYGLKFLLFWSREMLQCPQCTRSHTLNIQGPDMTLAQHMAAGLHDGTRMWAVHVDAKDIHTELALTPLKHHLPQWRMGLRGNTSEGEKQQLVAFSSISIISSMFGHKHHVFSRTKFQGKKQNKTKVSSYNSRRYFKRTTDQETAL